jgi:Dolichyl-phosphate-mannose-protein mannosyltransferase
MERHSSAYDAWAFTIIGLVAAVYLLTTAKIESFGSDTTRYFELAKSLRHDHRYWFNAEPHIMYPPGFPILLAGFMSLVGESFRPLVRLTILFDVAGIVGLYYFVKMRRGPSSALAVATLVATSYVCFVFSTVGLHSDGPYFTVSIFALLALDVGTTAVDRRTRIASCAAVAVLAAYLLLVRSIGVTFTIGMACWLVDPIQIVKGEARRLWRERVLRWAPAVVAPMVVFAMWSQWTAWNRPAAAAGDYAQSYSEQILKEDPHQIDSPRMTLSKIPARILRMLVIRTTNATNMIVNRPGMTPRRNAPLALVFFALAAIGFFASFLREATVLEWYILWYGAVLLIYPYDEEMRYLYPIQPFLILYGLAGIDWIRARISGSDAVPSIMKTGWMEPVKIAMFVLFVSSGLYQISLVAAENLSGDPSKFTNWSTVQVSTWIAHNTRPGDVIMDDQDAILHRLTGRRTLHFPLTTDAQVLKDTILAGDVRFIVVPDEKPYEYYNPSPMQRFAALKKLDPRLVKLVSVFDGARIYQVVADSR